MQPNCGMKRLQNRRFNFIKARTMAELIILISYNTHSRSLVVARRRPAKFQADSHLLFKFAGGQAMLSVASTEKHRRTRKADEVTDDESEQ